MYIKVISRFVSSSWNCTYTEKRKLSSRGGHPLSSVEDKMEFSGYFLQRSSNGEFKENYPNDEPVIITECRNCNAIFDL